MLISESGWPGLGLPGRGAPLVARSMGSHGAPRFGEFLSTPCRRIVGSLTRACGK